MKNKYVITILLCAGALVVLLFGAEVARNISFSAPKFDFSGITRPVAFEESPIKGADRPELVIYEYADFNCPYCKNMQPILDKILNKYSNQVALVWKDFPVVSEESTNAARESRCAAEQGKFWEYHDMLFEKRQGEISIDQDAFTKCLSDDIITSLVERDLREGYALGIKITPTFVIGDVAIEGEVSEQELERVIISELEKN